MVEDGKVEVHPGGEGIAARNEKQTHNRVLVHTHTVPTRIIFPFSAPFFAPFSTLFSAPFFAPFSVPFSIPAPYASTVALTLALAGASRPKLSNKVIDVSAVSESEERDSQRDRQCERERKVHREIKLLLHMTLAQAQSVA